MAAGRFAVAGTPADCVRVGLHDLAKPADWVLSGINAGGNLGADVYHSGTVAAVREGVSAWYLGVALSHYFRRGATPDWSRASRWVRSILRELLVQPWTPGSFWNINLPYLDADRPDPPLVYCPLDPEPLPLSFRREENLLSLQRRLSRPRNRHAGSDVDVCFNGNIALTRISVF